MSARQRARHRPAAPARRGLPMAVLAGAAVLVVAALGAWLLLRPSTAGEGPTTAAGLPGPIGGPDVAMDVNTLVGKPAPAFSLMDSEGRSYTVTPGQGRPVVLVSHMGIT